jgi:predicted ester cyclase
MAKRSPKDDIYTSFVAAVNAGDRAAMARCVSPVFQARLGGKTLNLNAFAAEIERQRTAFPDFGRDVRDVRVSEKGHTLRVTYTMTVTFSGPLTDGRGGSFAPTGRKVVIAATDQLTFGADGKITDLVSTSNLAMTLEQMFD